MESDPPAPLNYYGTSKLEGEHKVREAGGIFLILRTSWVYSLREQAGFVNKILKWSRQQTALKLVTDQISNPTWCRMLAEITAQILVRGHDYLSERAGLYHLAGAGFASRFDWAKLILELDPSREEQHTRELLPARTSDFPAPAQRPLFSALDCSLFLKTFDSQLPAWEEALKLAMAR